MLAHKELLNAYLCNRYILSLECCFLPIVQAFEITMKEADGRIIEADDRFFQLKQNQVDVEMPKSS